MPGRRYILAALLILAAPDARANPCTGTTSAGGRFAACFDPGNRLYLAGGSDGVGGAIQLRQALEFADAPDLVWKLEHTIARADVGGVADRFELVAYAGRYLRHSRSGHVVLPFDLARKLFLPFDVGGEVEAGRVSGHLDQSAVEIGVVRAAALIDLGRSPGFGRALGIGAVLRWDLTATPRTTTVTEHVVAPLSALTVVAHLESQNGLTVLDLRLEAGGEWSSSAGWRRATSASASLERTLLAINDRPLALVVGTRYRERELRGEVALRFALFQRLDQRVVLSRPLSSQ